MQPALITFDAYAALVDFRSSLLPVVEGIPGLDNEHAADFLELWRARQLAVATLSNALERERITFRDCTTLALDYCLRRYGLDVDNSGREDLVRAWYPLTPWPEANDVLATLRTKGYPLAILSNGDRDMLEALAARLETPFDHILSSEMCRMYKPHPSVYAIPARELGIENYLHVAGSPNDVIGAKAAGISCYWSNRQGDRVILPNYAPDHQGPDLAGILAVV
jgi:2-haloacid dehalogenase